MDLTTLAAAVLVVLSLLGTDAITASDSVDVTVAVAPAVKDIDQPTLAVSFERDLDAVTRTPSVVRLTRAPEIRAASEQSIGMALAKAANLDEVAQTLRRRLGYKPDTVRFTLFSEAGALRGLVMGESHLGADFKEVLVQEPGEMLMDFVRRCALSSARQLAPYSYALYLLQVEWKAAPDDKDFSKILAVVDAREKVIPPTGFDRSLYENLRGLVASLQAGSSSSGEARAEWNRARTAFLAAMAADPSNPVPFLNAAYVEVQLGGDATAAAAARMRQLIEIAPPTNKVLLGTAHTTLATALIERDLPAADRALERATQVNPSGAAAFELWSMVKERRNDPVAAEQLNRKARATCANFQNYAEVAVLYFQDIIQSAIGGCGS